MRKIYKLLLMLVLGIFILHGSSFGQNEYYLDFDGSNDYIYYADDATLGILDGASDYSIEAWIYPVDGRVAQYDRVLQRYYSFAIVMYDGNSDGDVEDWYFQVHDGSSWNYFNTEGDATLTLDAWNHIAVINNSSDGSLKLFVNGVDVTTSGGYSNKSMRSSVSSDNLYIGSQKGSTPNNSFGGYIDEVRLLNIALNPTVLHTSIIDNEYASDGNTAGLFHFNEGTGSGAENEASGTDGTLNNVLYWRTWDYQSGASLPFNERFVWNGSTSNVSSLAANWDPNIADRPNGTDIVIIPSGTSNEIFIEEHMFTCSDFSIEAGATATIGAVNGNVTCDNFTIENTGALNLYGFLTVNGTLTNNGGPDGLKIRSNLQYQGSLLHDEVGTDAMVERYIAAYTPGEGDDGWHLISSPVGDFTILGSTFVPGGSDDLFKFDAATYMWFNYRDGTPFTEMEKGIGYLCAYSSTTVHEFDNSTINVGDVSFNNLSTNAGWELLGNPFASTLSWGLGTWNRSNISGPQVWDEDMKDYTPATEFPPTQGFWVEVTDPINQITLPADARTHNVIGTYKSNDFPEFKIKVTGEQNNGWDFTTIQFREDASDNYDYDMDYHNKTGSEYTPHVFTVNSNNEEFCLEAVAPPVNEKIMPLYFTAGYNGEHQLSVMENTTDFENNIYLEDLLTGNLINLSTRQTYTFQASQDDDANRFLLHFNSTTGIEESTKIESVQIYSYNNQIYILSKELLDGQVNIYDLGGKLIQTQSINGLGLESISINEVSGVYFVELISQQKTYKEKVIIR